MLQKLPRYLLNPVVGALAAILLGYGTVALAQNTGPITLQPDEVRPVDGVNCALTFAHTSDQSHGTLGCGPSIEQHEGIDVCTDHDATVWHPLVKKDAAGVITCTYGHEHHADPNSVNDIFGPPSAWYGGNQAISYPWQTSGSAGQENHVKHEGYKWYLARDLECRPNGNPSFTGCYRAYRIQVHQLGTAADATVRFHSYSLEAVVQHPDGTQGMIRHGGWLDFGHLALSTSSGAYCPPMTTNPDTFSCDQNNHRGHGSINVPPPNIAKALGQVAWYANHETTALTLGFEEWGPIDGENPATQHLFDPSLKRNNSTGGLGNIALDGDRPWIRPLQVNGYTTWSGYTTSDGGSIATGCAAPSPTCVPTQLTKVAKIRYLYVANAQFPQGVPPNTEYDVMSPETGKSLIMFPN